jgi:signal peptidase I
MADTILPGDRILVDKSYYASHPIERGDVAIYLTEGAGSLVYVHRVVALGGDEIEIRNEVVYMNGERVQEPYVKLDPAAPLIPELTDVGPLVIPDECVFFLGDNRRESYDSRFIGCIPASDVLGRVHSIYWSSEALGIDPFTRKDRGDGKIRWKRIGKPVVHYRSGAK